MNKEEIKKLCADCENNYYNLSNHSHTGECWCLESAVNAESVRKGNGVFEMFVVGINTPYPDKNSYSIGKRPKCWQPRRGDSVCKWKAPT